MDPEAKLTALEREVRNARFASTVSMCLALAALVISTAWPWSAAGMAFRPGSFFDAPQLEIAEELEKMTQRSEKDAFLLVPVDSRKARSFCRHGCRVKIIGTDKRARAETGRPEQKLSRFAKRSTELRQREVNEIRSRLSNSTAVSKDQETVEDRPAAHLWGKVAVLQRHPFPIHSLSFSTGDQPRGMLKGVGQGTGDDNSTLIIRTAGLYHVYGQVIFNDHRLEAYTLRLTLNDVPMAVVHQSNTPVIVNGSVVRRSKAFRYEIHDADPSIQQMIGPIPDVPPFQRNSFLKPLSFNRIFHLNIGDRLDISACGPGAPEGHVLLMSHSRTVHFFGLYKA